METVPEQATRERDNGGSATYRQVLVPTLLRSPISNPHVQQNAGMFRYGGGKARETRERDGWNNGVHCGMPPPNVSMSFNGDIRRVSFLKCCVVSPCLFV